MRLKSLILVPMRVLEHNDEHVTKIHIFGEEIKACSRCLGLYASGLICYVIFAYIYVYTNIRFSFWFVFITSAALGSVTLIDWASVSLHIREGNEKVRITAGVLLGIGGIFYFWFLPASWLFRILTLICFNLIAIVLALVAMWRKEREAQTNTGIGG